MKTELELSMAGANDERIITYEQGPNILGSEKFQSPPIKVKKLNFNDSLVQCTVSVMSGHFPKIRDFSTTKKCPDFVPKSVFQT